MSIASAAKRPSRRMNLDEAAAFRLFFSGRWMWITFVCFSCEAALRPIVASVSRFLPVFEDQPYHATKSHSCLLRKKVVGIFRSGLLFFHGVRCEKLRRCDHGRLVGGGEVVRVSGNQSRGAGLDRTEVRTAETRPRILPSSASVQIAAASS
jgi:hypothetical protein